MLMSRERRTATRTLRGWAMSVLKEVGAVRECEEHGWMQDRTDPHARERAIDIARRDPLPGFSPEAAAAEVRGCWIPSGTHVPSVRRNDGGPRTSLLAC
jgi:hypothetical protein